MNKIPTDFEWQLGKSCASKTFVRDAIDAVEQSSDPSTKQRLLEEIRAIQTGVVHLTEYRTVEEFLADTTA